MTGQVDVVPGSSEWLAARLAEVRTRYTRTEGKAAVVDGTVWAAWCDARDCADYWAEQAAGYELAIREQLGDAHRIQVDGELVGSRIVVNAYVKQHQDYIRRTGRNGRGDDE